MAQSLVTKQDKKHSLNDVEPLPAKRTPRERPPEQPKLSGDWLLDCFFEESREKIKTELWHLESNPALFEDPLNPDDLDYELVKAMCKPGPG